MTNEKKKSAAEEREALALPPMGRGMQLFALAVVFVLAVGGTAFVLLNPLGLAGLPRLGAVGSAGETASDRLYQCPMHPDVIEPNPADCPVCGMPLVELQSTPSAAAEPLHQCPMHPDVIEPNPADCPICGMPLVPMEPTAPSGDDDVTTVRIDPVQVQNTGIVSAVARQADIARQSRTVGILDFDAEGIAWVNTKFAGWIEKVFVNYVGQSVRLGEPLFEIYSPELVTTQEEYLRALDYRDSLVRGGREGTRRQAESLVRSARERLAYWDIAAEQIERLEAERRVERRLTVHSPAAGVVTALMQEALEGMYVKPGMDLYRIADLGTIWVHADIYESDMPWIREGQDARVSFRNDAGRVYDGAVLFLYPEVSPDTRTLKICVEVPNPDGRLRPGMYADVTVHGPPVRDAVVIPQSAVLRSGERNLVFVDLGEGRFEPREVALGVRGEGDAIQVTRGVAPGEAVVTQGQFMLDSESRVQEAIARLSRGSTPSGSAQPAEHTH